MSEWERTGWQPQVVDREAVALSVVIKIALLVAIVLAITGLWALSSPAAQPLRTDATLGPPLGPGQVTQVGAPESR